jgi:hypothetical protein
MNDNEQSANSAPTTYGEALEYAGHFRGLILNVVRKPNPKLLIESRTQQQLLTVVAIMALIGRAPKDFTYDHFERPITFRKLSSESLDRLERLGIPARRDFAPLGSEYYADLFGDRALLPVSESEAGRFFSRLIDFLLIETQIIVAKQYYHGLDLYHPKEDSLLHIDELLSGKLPLEFERIFRQANPAQVYLDQLHGRIFLEYCAVMIRAQWDKLTRLICSSLKLDDSWDSVSKGLRKIEANTTNQNNLDAKRLEHLQIFLDIAHQRLAEDGWLKKFRDPLLHDVSQHSAGVLPRRNSLETTSEMWDRARDEHDWLRESVLAVFMFFLPMNYEPPTSQAVRR